MDYGDNSGRSGGSASRPPQGGGNTDDFDLFTEYSPTSRRAPSYGRPSSGSVSGNPGGTSPRTSSPYGGRDYTSSSRSNSAAASRQRPQQSRQAPVYTELSWDDLRRGADLSGLGRSAPTPTPSAARPVGGAGASYFGGFSQEMEELYYNQPTPEPPTAPGGQPQTNRTSYAAPRYGTTQTRPGGYGAAPPRQSGYSAGPTRPSGYGSAQPRQPMDRSAAPGRGQQSANPFAGLFSRPAHQSAPRPAQRSQSVSRPAASQQRPASPAPARRGTPATPQWQPAANRSGGNVPPNGGNGRAGYSARPRQQSVNPVIYMVGFVLLALMIFLVARLVGGNSRSSNTNVPNVPHAPNYSNNNGVVTNTADNTAEPTSPSDPEATPEATPAVTPTPSPVPTPTPSGPKAQRSGNLIVPADWGPVVPERNNAVYDSHFDRACMIGNSLVEGFRMWSGMNNIRYIYHTGVGVDTALGTLDMAPITLNEPGYYTDIYLMFGLNEIGIDVNTFTQSYKKFVDYIRQYQPDANIYVISVTPVTERVDKDPGEVQTMERIDRFNAALKEFCVDQHCWYLDIYSMLLDGQGYLSSDYAYEEDGKHFEKSGYVAWANYMKTHYVDENLITE